LNLRLFEFDKTLKQLLSAFIIALTFGVLLGLTFLYYTTNYSAKGTIERFRGSQIENENTEMDIPENYPKPVSEMFITTHNHIISFSLIFISISIIFYFNSTINGFWKKFFLIEPFISIVTSFSSIWAVRFVDKNFVYITVISAILIYLSYFVMTAVSLYELNFKKKL